MPLPLTPTQFRRAALLWWAGAAAFFVAGMDASHRPMFWLVAALFTLNGGLAMHRARACKDAQ